MGEITRDELSQELIELIENASVEVEIPHNGRLYTGLDDLGITDEDFSLDLNENLYKIVDKMEKFSTLLVYTGKTKADNLKSSITSRFLSDLSISYSEQKDYSIKITKYDSTRLPSFVEIIPNQEGTTFCTYVDRNVDQDISYRLSRFAGLGTIDNPIRIKAGSNLDDFKTPGFYNIPLSKESETIANVPQRIAAAVEIIKTLMGDSVTQIYRPYHEDMPYIYIRNYYETSKSWGEWGKSIVMLPDGYLKDQRLKIIGTTDSLTLRNSEGSNQHGIIFENDTGTRIFEIEERGSQYFYIYDNVNKKQVLQYNNANSVLETRVNSIKMFEPTNAYGHEVFRVFTGDNTGMGLYVQSGGLTVIGGGEGADTFRANFKSTGSEVASWTNASENIVLYSDDQIRLYTGGQTWASRKSWNFVKDGTARTPSGAFLSGTFFGTGTPTASSGLNGDIYIKY